MLRGKGGNRLEPLTGNRPTSSPRKSTSQANGNSGPHLMGRNRFGQEATGPGEATRRAGRWRDRQKRQKPRVEDGGGEAGSTLPFEDGSPLLPRSRRLSGAAHPQVAQLGLKGRAGAWASLLCILQAMYGCNPPPPPRMIGDQAWSARPSSIPPLCSWERSPRFASGSLVGGLGRRSARGRVLTPSPARSVGGAARDKTDS